MAFDLIQFLNSRRIDYVTSGPNTSRGNIAIHCPLCGPEDASKHMSVSLTGHGWRCWRRPDKHFGRSPARLVMLLIGCSYEQACAITGVNTPHPPTDLLSSVRALLTPSEPPPRANLKLPHEFQELSETKPSARPYLNYLYSRGLTDLQYLRSRNIRYCTQGSYKGRIIVPVEQDGKLLTWTGRTISKRETLRYKTLSTDREKARDEGYQPALQTTSNCLLWYDRLQVTNADTLYIVEGPFDALKLDYLGEAWGIAATCLFTLYASDVQLGLLHTLLPRFRRAFVLLDDEATAPAMALRRRLEGLDVSLVFLPEGVKDPGVLNQQTFSQLIGNRY